MSDVRMICARVQCTKPAKNYTDNNNNNSVSNSQQNNSSSSSTQTYYIVDVNPADTAYAYNTIYASLKTVLNSEPKNLYEINCKIVAIDKLLRCMNITKEDKKRWENVKSELEAKLTSSDTTTDGTTSETTTICDELTTCTTQTVTPGENELPIDEWINEIKKINEKNNNIIDEKEKEDLTLEKLLEEKKEFLSNYNFIVNLENLTKEDIEFRIAYYEAVISFNERILKSFKEQLDTSKQGNLYKEIYTSKGKIDSLKSKLKN